MNQLDQYRQVQTFKISEVLIDAPRQKVWPYFLDYTKFNDTIEKVEHLWGEPNTVGAISRLTKGQGKWHIPPYLAKVVHIDEGTRIVWKVYPEEGEDYSAFVEFSLAEVNGKTLFTIRNFKENRVSVRTPEALDAFVAASNATSDRMHQEVSLPNIKRLCEQNGK